MLFLPIQRTSKKRRARREWQHVALVAGFLSGRHFVGTKDLHYGFWREGMDQSISNLPHAQDEYSAFLMQNIPWTAKKILDVGSGAGSVAQQLIARGHTVDCVSPSESLNRQARQLLGDRARLFDCRYEDFESTGLYDCVVFCESFQYVDMATALSRAAWQLGEGSRLVICDFFKRDVDGRSPIGGGHRLKDFWALVARFPYRIVRDLDITNQVAPTFTVIDQAFREVVQPVWQEVRDTVTRTHPRLATFASWWFRRRIEKFERKYLGNSRTAENFEKFKSYRLMVFERTAI